MGPAGEDESLSALDGADAGLYIGILTALVTRPEGLPFVWDDQTLMNSTTLTLDTDLARIDFLAEPDGANNYKEMKSRAATFDLDGHTIYVASIEDLLAMKRAAGRPQDVQDIAQLETIKRLREEE